MQCEINKIAVLTPLSAPSIRSIMPPVTPIPIS